MEQDGYVSLWVGNFHSKEDMQNYLEISYTEDGDAVPSQFEEDFEIESHDEDFFEIVYFEGIQNLPTLLAGCSYDDVVIPNFVERHGEILNDSVNSMILLYNFQYNEKVRESSNNLRYIGSVKYK